MDPRGQRTIIYTSNSTGEVTAHASSTRTLGTPPPSVHVETDGTGLNSGDGVKTFVNAKISINPPTATNEIGDAHMFTVTVLEVLGDGNPVVAAAGEHVDFTLTDSLGASSTL